jgi:hypothetical protein
MTGETLTGITVTESGKLLLMNEGSGLLVKCWESELIAE